MKSVAIIAALLMAFSPSLASGEMEASAEVVDADFLDEFAFLEDAGMVESAALHRQEIGMSPSAITVITREDIEASGATTITDLLRIVPGMDVITASPSYSGTSSRMYWTSENFYILVLIDGREANVELMGQAPWGLQPISLDDIERIEVLKGPSSSLYGANAVCGVITITTRIIPEETSAFVRLAGGEVGVLEMYARAGTQIGDWGFSVSAGADLVNSFQFPRSTDKQVLKARAIVEYRLSENQRFRMDASFAEGTGMVSGSVSRMEMDYGLRAVRLSYESPDLQGQIYWSQTPVSWTMTNPLEFGGIRLATFTPTTIDGHTVVTNAQWTLPEFYKPLLFIVGGGGRMSWIGSDQLLASTYDEITSPDYHKTGLSHWVSRAGAFVHSEYTPFDWMTITGSLRFDYNTETDPFLSPRLAAVVKPAEGQFVRASVARAFRKPSFVENQLHMQAEFPDESPITGPAREAFQEFMSRSIGNPNLGNEVFLSFDVGYLGKFLDDRLSIALDLYLNQQSNTIEVDAKIVPNQQGLPDLDLTTLKHIHGKRNVNIVGSEVTLRYSPSKAVALMASWTHREVFSQDDWKYEDKSPKNLITVGGRFKTESGLVGSLYFFSRSKFPDRYVDNPAGMLEPSLSIDLDNSILILGKLGWRWKAAADLEFEAGVKLFLPFSPFSGDLFSYYEQAGGVTPLGTVYGGEALRRMVTGYLQGSF
jgi:iron complex outermembrane receptor protein